MVLPQNWEKCTAFIRMCATTTTQNVAFLSLEGKKPIKTK